MDMIVSGWSISLFQAWQPALDDGVVIFEDAVREPILAEVLPDVLDRVQLGRARWQQDDGEVLGDLELVGAVPPGAVHQDDAMGLGGQVSRAAKLLDEELEAWRNRPLGEIRYLLLDARYEKVREAGVVRDAAVLSAIGIGPDQRRRVLGVSCAISEAEVHWRVFLESLVARGMRGVAYIVSDDHPGLGAARKAVLGGASWQRCQFHLAQNAIHHAPNLAIRKRIGKELRRVWDAADLKAAEAELARLVESYRDKAAKLALWLEDARRCS